MDFQDRNDLGDSSEVAASEGASATSAVRSPQTVVIQPDANNIVTLPPGVSFDTIVADGRDLIIQADGVIYVIPDGAIIVPQLVVGGVTVPALNLAALLVGNEIVPAADPGLQSSGGNFETAPGDIQDAYGLGDLLPYTELAFPQPQDEEIIPNLADREPTVIVITPDNPVGAINAVATVNEAGLPARSGEPAGSDAASDSETTTGTINYDSPDGTDAVLINGVAITTVGQTFTSPDGTLTITSLADGAIGFSYTLNDNLVGVTEDGFFTVTVIDTDGDTASASLLINVLDDAPIAVDDTDSVAAGTYDPETGNVITGTGTTSGDAGADTQGADGAALTAIANGSGTTANVTGPTIIAGEYGTLTIQSDGDYTYVRNPGTPGGVSESFTYTLTDADGSTATAVLTINIGDSPVAIVSLPEAGDDGTIVDESGLPTRGDESPGTQEPTLVETTTGTITFVAPDGPATVEINGVVVTAPGQTITVPEGTLTIIAYDPDTGVIGYSFTLADNTSGDETSVTFDVTVTDVDGDSDTGSFTITILDDVPLAMDDFATQVGEDTPVTVNVFANDIQGADSVQLDAIAAVDGTLSGTGTLTYNDDGTFTYTPTPGEEGSVTFDYTITDGDGDVSTATVTIALGDDSTPTISASGDTAVDEAGLPARAGEPEGSQAADNSEIANGIITITTGGDTLGSLVINGVNVTAGGTVTTDQGTLVVTLDAGVYSYTYTLTDNTLTNPDTDTFTLTVTDSDGDPASTTLVIAIVDDNPFAQDDAAALDAGEYGPATGSVTANDTPGADGIVVTSYTGNGGTGAADSVVQGLYGTLTIGADGNFSYVRDPGTPGGVTDNFSYLVTDGDGDTATANLVISIADSPTTLDVPVTGEAGTQVLEAGLASGSAAPTDGEFTAGSIGFTAPDGPAVVTIDGTVVTLVGQTFTGDFGTLTITSIGAGTIGYSYELTTNTSGDTTADSFDIVVSDADGDSTPGVLTIDIVDDVPIARPDVDSVTEDGPLIADGNVITGADQGDTNTTDGFADTQGADGASVVAVSQGATSGTVGTGLVGSYGTLILDDDGTYSYELNNTNPLVQGLDSTEQLSETFNYTIRDGDGDESSTTLVITINGTDDGVTINGLDGQGAEETVFENDLLDGSSPDSGALTQTGSFDLTSPDGLSTITVGGTTIYTGGAFVTGQALTTPYGTLTITGVTPTVTDANGDVTAATVSYSYELTDNTLTHTAADDVSLTDSFAVVVTDTDGSSATDSLDITVVDDVPTANDDDVEQVAENQAFTIDALDNDVFGADSVDTSDIADVFVASQPAQGAVTYDPATGLFTYTPNSGAGSTTTTDSFTYTIVDGDGDSSTATVNVVLQPDSIPNVVSVTALSDDDGLAGGNPAFDTQDVDANFGDDPLTVSEATFSGTITVDFGNDTGTVSFANLDGTSGTVGTETVDYSWSSGSNTLTATGPRGVLFTVEMDANGNYVLTQADNILHAEGNGELSAADVVLAYRASDSDGDTDDSGTLTISFNDDAPTATADTNTLDEGGTVGGNVLTDGVDDIFGADGPAATAPAGGVIGVAAGNDISVAATGTPGVQIESALGFLTLNADGSYSYASKANSTNADATDVFTYTIQDGDGDISTQTLTISVSNVAGQVSDNDVTVDESGLDGTGSQLVPAGEFDLDGQITVTGASGTLIYTLTDPAIGTFGELVLNSATGEYTYELTSPVTDTTGDDGRNVISGPANGAEAFGYQVSDTNGNLIGTGTITINIVDDVPIAVNEAALSIVEDASGPDELSGNVLDNDTQGADGATVTSVNIGGTDYAIAAGGTTPVSTANGDYVFDAAGNWTFNPNSGLDQTAGPVDASFTYTLTDGDGDTDTAVQPITITDGAPPQAGAPINLTVDDENLPTGSVPAAMVEDSASIVFTPGSDAITSIVFSTDLSALDPALTWVRVDGDTVTGSDGTDLIVTLELTLSGNTATVTATLSDNFDSHPNSGDDSFALGSVGVVATDTDGDTAIGTVNLAVSDDLPVVTGTDASANALEVDETTLGTPDTADFATLFTAAFNADGAAASNAITYVLGVSTPGVGSGLVDVATSQDVLLRINGAGEVEGYITDGGAGTVVFTLSVDTAGTATLTQARAVTHSPNVDANDAATLSGTDLITLTATITDGDLDIDTAIVDLTGGLTFYDDGPSIVAAVSDGDAIELVTQDAETDGDPTDFDTATADFSGAFTISSSNYGADGAGSIVWDYDLILKAAEGSDTGLTSGGATIYLYQAADGTVIGSTSNTEAGITAGNTIFDLTINATGSVTSTQYAALDHSVSDADNYATDELLLPTGLVAISGTATITDRDGDETASEAVELDLGGNIIFADDGPQAVADTDSVTEDGPLTATGNVITNAEANGDNGADSTGADGAVVGGVAFGNTGAALLDGTTVDAGVAGTYGSISIDANGAYTYTLGNTNPLVQGLDSTETLTEIFTYTLQDGDGDTTFTTVTITINGADDGVTINGLDGAGAEETLFENDLTDGSSPDNAALTQTGTFTVDSPDGLALLTVGGVTVFDASNPVGFPVTVSDPVYGILTITGVTATTTDANGDVTAATISYTYVLDDNSLLHTGGNDGSFTDSFTVVATDTDGSNDTASLDITIVDDVPTAVADTNTVTEGGQTTGNLLTDGVDDTFGADGAATTVPTGGITGIRAANGNTTTPITDGTTVVATTLGTLTLNADGSYVYNANANVITANTQDVFVYTIRDGDGDLSTTTLTIDLTAINGTVSDNDVLVNEAGLDGIGSDAASNSESFTTGAIIASGGFGDLTYTLNDPANGTYGTLTLNALTGTYSYVLDTPFDGPATQGTDTVLNAETFSYTVTDSLDNVIGTGTIGVNIIDDIPVIFDPEDGSVANTDSPATAFDLNYGTAVGADGLGDVVFSITNGDPAVDSNGNVLSFQGSPLAISGNGTNVLTASTAGGVVGFTITIDPDTDQYVVDLAGTIANGGEFSISNLTSAAAGNTEYRVVGANDQNNNSDNIDILLSGRASDGVTRGTINTNSTAVGIGNQSTNPGEAVRIDFINNATSGGGGVSGFNYDGHQDVVRFEQVIAQTGGNANTRVEIDVTAIDADDDQDFSFNGTTPEAGESFVDITEVMVTDQNGGPGGSQIVYTFAGTGTQGAITVTFNANGSVNIDGLQVNDLYEVSSGDAFSAILVESPPGNNNFDLGIFDITTQNSADPIDVAYDIVGTDADGDFVTITDGIQVTFAPVIVPIVLDLDGDGAEFLDLSAGVAFDYGSGLVSTAWVGSDDGLLARSTETGLDIVFADDAVGAQTDLEGLALAYDSNGDHRFDASDAAFAEFGVWQDADSDGVVDAGEFRSLTDAGILSINLTSDGQAYTAANGDVLVHGTGSYTNTDGSTGQLADASFATEAVAAMNQRGSQVAAVNAVIAALVMPEMLVAMDQEASSLVPTGSTLGSDQLVSSSGISTTAMPDQMALASDGFFSSSNTGLAPVSSQSIGQANYESVSLGGDQKAVGFEHAELDTTTSDPVFAFGSGPGVSAFSVPSVEGTQMMDALLTLGQGAAITGQALVEEGAVRLTLDMPALQEAFADVVDGHAVDAIVDHFAGALEQGAAGSASYDASILNVGIGDAQTFFGMQPLDNMTAEDMSALAASA